ncbi:hypothetical protein CI109_102132 [Kwoniella shandongensis]|uniref:Uncharacterized protein n=1 Tax=Kwoniella shandongensis TaxID=1734106 RepID=A0A5M6BZA4_9TREE|nr:uncharacterized protein CI109_003708 [Kwoniella shandongensis]KAA5528053.1 hypothetical protein CI109_003708 [Kwoniella shandongensis]
MSTAFASIVLAPAVHNGGKGMSPETNNSYSTHQSITLDTPRSNSDDVFHTYQSGSSSGQGGRQQQHRSGQNGISPSPESTSPISNHHSQQTSMYSTSQQPYSYPNQQYSSPSKQPDWHAQVAGPSTYRRAQSPQAMSSPMSGSEYYDGAAAGRSQQQARSSSGPRPTGGDQKPIEPVGTDGRVGVDEPWGERKYTELKCLGDGSFGTVWLCDWHSPVKSDILLSAMQCGAGARPEWAGKRLVALKRMKRVWEGGWKQAKTLGELVSLSRIPPHPAIIPLYDAFISPKSRELYFVFECMEGNLYQLTKSRRGRPLASGLIASCFHQISTGLHHIHRHGYFHRDMKPENLLVTTTGLTDYLTGAALAQINSSRGVSQDQHQHSLNPDAPQYEKDVSVIVKLADFGLARATDSKPPYTEYVSTRWYRAPEVLLRSTEYGPPVDMWALGTILAEMLNLKPLFPGVSEIDQVYRICDTMGDPSADYGVDERGKTIGGGSWNSGIKLAKNVGFSFPKRKPVRFRGLFNDTVPQSLVDCIADLLRYNPKYRMTAAQCIDHAYFHETLPHLQRTPPLPRIPFSQGQPAPGAARPPPTEIAAAPRQLPPSHSHTPHEARPAFANGDMRTLPPPVGTPDGGSPSASHRLFFPTQSHLHNTHADSRAYAASASALVHQLRELDLPTDDLASYGNRPPPSPGARRESAQSQNAGTQRSQQWANDVALNTRRPSNTHSSMYDGSVFEGSQGGQSNTNFTSYSTASVERTPEPYAQPKSHVAAYVQQQQRYAQETPRAASSSQLSLAPPIEPTLDAVRADKLGASAKKKKWGLSSVFGGVGKSTTDLATVDENAYHGTSSLKRTQSGNRPQDRSPVIPMPTISDDPKKAKKEAERQAKELAKAQREAMALKQKERARAVLQKRNQLIEVRKEANVKSEIEFSSGDPPPGQLGSSMRQAPILTSASSMSLGKGLNPSSRDLRTYGGPSSQSMASVRSHDSGHSGHSGRSGLSAAALAAYDDAHGGVSRQHKARRRDDDDDHSMSSFGHNSLRSRSVLTVGTVDSDPGPRRSARSEWQDPIQRHHDPKRAPSVTSFHQQSLMSRSNASLESQLAHDFKIHANVGAGAGAGTSSTSLGRHGTSQLSLQGNGVDYPSQGLANGSAPTSPYGHPKGTAVAFGAGMGRHGTVLPSISSWEGSGVGEAQINPMFRVPPAGHQSQQGTTLPPFSAIASVAGQEGHGQGQGHNQG